MPIEYALKPEWKIVQKDASLIISGGADAMYQLDLETEAQSFFTDISDEKRFRKTDLDVYDQRIFEQLLSAEIIRPVLNDKKRSSVAMIGDDPGVSIRTSGSVTVTSDAKKADLLVINRHTSTFTELFDSTDYLKITTPHLFVDMAYHHTISIGPLVIPGDTACIACLEGRLVSRWGAEELPRTPKSGDLAGITSELVMTELHRISDGDTSLVNKTVTWNFQDRTVKSNKLLKVPFCPKCNVNKLDRDGLIALPWIKDEKTTDAI